MEAKRKSETGGLGSFPEMSCVLLCLFLPADPQMSMAATAAVSPSDYLQPAAATTQASGLEGGVLSCLGGLTEANVNHTQNPFHSHFQHPET